jgi:hypothetical protein
MKMQAELARKENKVLFILSADRHGKITAYLTFVTISLSCQHRTEGMGRTKDDGTEEDGR